MEEGASGVCSGFLDLRDAIFARGSLLLHNCSMNLFALYPLGQNDSIFFPLQSDLASIAYFERGGGVSVSLPIWVT